MQRPRSVATTPPHLNAAEATLVHHLPDKRSRRVVFLAHCILNENTRYLGGACRGGCIREIVQQCIDRDLGVVQMPCPEQSAWGGVLKRRLLLAYGLQQQSPLLYRFRSLLVPLALWYTRQVYRRMARGVARQVEDYLRSGFSVAAVVGVDGSPTCGIETTIRLRASHPILCSDVDTISPASLNALLRASAERGRGIFIEELQQAMRRRGIVIPFTAHDLFAELEGRQSPVVL